MASNSHVKAEEVGGELLEVRRNVWIGCWFQSDVGWMATMELAEVEVHD
jgi:hypothetical protein